MDKRFFRNKTALTSMEGILVDEFSLWEKRGELMVLVEDGTHVTTAYDKNLFICSEEL